jgi:glucosamine--fructose-6-phosphate aminotransferase (isomerizing)
MENNYFMYNEIHEELKILNDYKKREDFLSIKDEILSFNPCSFMIASRGTSDNASVFGKYVIESTYKIPVSFASFSLFTWYNSYPHLERVIGIGVSQSGETQDVIKVIESFNNAGSLTIGITNSISSTLAKISKIAFHLNAGEEKSIAATKTYFASLLFFLGLANAFKKVVDFDSITDSVSHVFYNSNIIKDLVIRYRFAKNFIILGRGFNYPNALEFALKLRETSLVNAIGYSSIDFLHGPIASLSSETPVIFLMPKDETFPSNLEILQVLISYNAHVLVITDGEVPKGVLSFNIKGSNTLEYPIAIATFLQLFSFYLSVEKQLNPDKPERLRKVTYGI